MNKKTKLAILGVIGLVLITLSLTYAYWLITRTQTKENIITAGCLDISLSNEQNDISLTEQFPLSDDEGKELTPYIFTVTNNCNTTVDYNVNLEVLGDKDSNMDSSSIKVMLDDGTPVLVSNKLKVEATISDAYEAHLLTQGTLAAKGTATHNVILWIDEEAPISEMNKTFSSKVSVTAGQGIINPIKEGTLAYNLVSQYNGAESTAILDEKYVEYIEAEETTNNFPSYASSMFGTSYELDEETGKFYLTGDVITATWAECKSGTKKCGDYFLGYDQYYNAMPNDGMSRVDKKSSINSSGGVKYKRIYSISGYYTIPDKSYVQTAQDDYGISYVLNGDVENNYVKFGKWSDSDSSGNAGKDMYWRIIRVNGDGTIRMIYAGIEKYENKTSYEAHIGKSIYDESSVGYTYEKDGKQVDSAIKAFIDTWYEDNLKTNYEKYIADSIFCNDRSVIESSYLDESGNMINSSEGAYAYGEIYGYKSRHKNTPTLVCKQKEDRYTMSKSKGNGYLRNPVGLITADEVRIAGADIVANNFTIIDLGQYNYLINEYGYYTNTPVEFAQTLDGTLSGGSVYAMSSNSLSEYGNATDTYVRPVINLKSDVSFTGNGSYETPYVIRTN